MASIRTRGYIGVLYQLFVTFGIVINSLLLLTVTLPRKYHNYWLVLLAAVVVFCMCTLLAFFLPDPKFWCGKKGKVQVEAQEEKALEVKPVSCKVLFTDKKYKRSLIVGCFYAIGQ